MWWTIATALASGVPYEQTIDAPGHSVEIEVICGDLRIVGRDGEGVHVVGTLDAPDLLLARPGRIEPTRRKGKDTCVHLTVEVPGDATLDVTAVSASVDVAKVTGVLKIESVSGSIAVAGTPRSLDATVVSGSVTLEGAMPQVRAGSVSGPVTLVTTAPMSSVELTSVSGPVAVTGPLASGGRLEGSSHSGAVKAVLPSDLDARIELSTMSGPRVNEFGSDTVGHGTGTVKLSTFSGPVSAIRSSATTPPTEDAPPPPDAPPSGEDAPPPPAPSTGPDAPPRVDPG